MTKKRTASDSDTIAARPFLEPLRRVERATIAALLLLMSGMYVLDVVARELVPVLAPALVWVEEAALFGLAWCVFLGLGLVLERGRHIAMTVLFDRLPAGVRRPIALIIDLTGLAFSIYLVRLSFDLTVFVWNSGQISPTLGVSMAWLYSAMPFGFALLGLRYLIDLIGLGRRFEVAGHGHEL